MMSNVLSRPKTIDYIVIKEEEHQETTHLLPQPALQKRLPSDDLDDFKQLKLPSTANNVPTIKR